MNKKFLTNLKSVISLCYLIIVFVFGAISYVKYGNVWGRTDFVRFLICFICAMVILYENHKERQTDNRKSTESHKQDERYGFFYFCFMIMILISGGFYIFDSLIHVIENDAAYVAILPCLFFNQILVETKRKI